MPFQKALLFNTLTVLVSITITLSALEWISRWVAPISPGVEYYDADGHHITIGTGDSFRLRPGNHTQVSKEYSARISITQGGYRGTKMTKQPELIFLGDSFTFGQGLSDEETFPEIYCESLGLQCVNLGRSGSGTIFQVELLSRSLEAHSWSPRTVMIFLMVMTDALMEGNDLRDNIRYAREHGLLSTTTVRDRQADTKTSKTVPESGWNFTEILLEFRRIALVHSNLVRVVYSYTAPILRILFSPRAAASQVELGLSLTQTALQELDNLGRQYDFVTEIVVLHPMQDIARGTAQETFDAIKAIAPHGVKVTPTHQLFEATLNSSYYLYDGHFTPLGAKQLADFLLQSRGR